MVPAAATTAVRWALAATTVTAAAALAGHAASGAAPLLAVAVQGIVAASSLALLLHGRTRDIPPRDRGPGGDRRPSAGPRAIHFWALVIGLLFAALGAGALVVEGFARIFAPAGPVDPRPAYGALGAGLVVTAYAAWRAVAAAPRRGADDPTALATLVQSVAVVAGLLAALAGHLVADRFAMPAALGAATLAVALVLAMTAVILALEVKSHFAQAQAAAAAPARPVPQHVPRDVASPSASPASASAAVGAVDALPQPTKAEPPAAAAAPLPVAPRSPSRKARKKMKRHR